MTKNNPHLNSESNMTEAAIAKLRETDFGIPLQFTNFRD